MKDQEIRILVTSPTQSVAFRAGWKAARVAAHEFTYEGAVLKAERRASLPPAWRRGWRAVRVLPGAEHERLLRVATERLAPREALHGIYLQYLLEEAVVFRDATGRVQLVPFGAQPEGVVIDRRLGRQELFSTLAQTIEADLRAAYPNETAFLVMPLPDQEFRLALFDFAERHAATIYAPHVGDDPRLAPSIAMQFSMLAEFVLVDHGWAFLKNPVSSTTRSVNQGTQWLLSVLGHPFRARNGIVGPVTNAPSMDLVQWEAWLDRHTHTRREQGTVKLLIDGEKFFPHLEKRIAGAQSNVCVQISIFDRDDVGVQVADQLKARSTNAAVQVMFDRICTRGAGDVPPATPLPDDFQPPRSIGSHLRDGARVQVRGLLNPCFTVDHTKLLLFDRRYAILGGMNFGREYRYEWHDLMFELEGPIVGTLQQQFDIKWAQAGVWGDAALAIEKLFGNEAAETVAPPGSIELRRLRTRTFDRQIRRAELEAIDRARSHIFLENAYLYDKDVIRALVRARARGVDVRVILPGKNDFTPGHSSNLVTANYLRQRGVRVYFYPGMTHVKALLVDGWACLGSANFDAFSLRLNRETNLATSDPGFVGQFRREVFDVDFAKSRELEENVSVDWGDELADVIMNLF